MNNFLLLYLFKVGLATIKSLGWMLKFSNRNDTETPFFYAMLTNEELIKEFSKPESEYFKKQIMTDKKTRVPRSLESILKGALELTLEGKVKLRNELTTAIEAEVKELEEKLIMAKQVVNGKSY